MNGKRVSVDGLDRALRAQWPGLKAYVVSLLGGHPGHADDVLQETALFVWNNRDKLAEVDDFQPWIFRIAYFKAQSKRRDLARDKHTVFSEQIFERLATEAETEFSGNAESRLNALGACVATVSEDDRALLVWRYSDNKNLVELARLLGRSADSIHQKISRLRRSLRLCVEKRLAATTSHDAL